MLARIRSAYLREEERFNRWGGLGKILVAVEVMTAAGVDPGALRLEAVVNAAYPRTISRKRKPDAGEVLPGKGLLRGEVAAMTLLFEEWGMSPERADRLALEEVGERRQIDASFLREYLKSQK